jgi:hypothetical protein
LWLLPPLLRLVVKFVPTLQVAWEISAAVLMPWLPGQRLVLI